MATLMATTTLILLTGLLGWLTLKAVSAETTRSQQQMFAAQALANSEALLETAIAYIDNHYMQNGAQADAQLWANASPQDCPANKAPAYWQCLRIPLALLPLPDFTDTLHSSVTLVRDGHNTPHQVLLVTELRLNDSHAGVGSRATVQAALFVPVPYSATLSPAQSHPTLWPPGIHSKQVQRLPGSWKNAGY